MKEDKGGWLTEYIVLHLIPSTTFYGLEKHFQICLKVLCIPIL